MSAAIKAEAVLTLALPILEELSKEYLKTRAVGAPYQEICDAEVAMLKLKVALMRYRINDEAGRKVI